MNDRIKKIIQNADLVLIGIGEEFEGECTLRQIPEYMRLREKVETDNQDWLIPFLNRYFTDRIEDVNPIKQALINLAELIKGKNYFLVSIATNDYVWEAGFKEDRVVAPCGGSLKKQCAGGGSCEIAPVLLSEEEKDSVTKGVEAICAKQTHKASTGMQENISLGNCPGCGKPMILNNIYTDKYDERGYLEMWQKYTKWLQGTLNKKLCILELGVGMQCPSVIRFPFEKIGYFNQKADFIRVNKNLYQLTEELKEKGISISENAVDWLTSLW